jgi:hypothetical protein
MIDHAWNLGALVYLVLCFLIELHLFMFKNVSLSLFNSHLIDVDLNYFASKRRAQLSKPARDKRRTSIFQN